MPHTRIVICKVVAVGILAVVRVSRVEVELALGGIPQSVVPGKFHQVGRGQVVLLVVGVVFTQAALVAGYEVLVAWYAGGKPAVTAGVLQVPHFLVVDEADAEAFGRAVLLDKRTEALHALACRVDIRQDDVVGAVLSQSVGHVGVEFQRFVAAEDGLGRAHAHTLGIEAGTSPFAGELVVGQSGVAQGLFRQWTLKGTVFGAELSGPVFCGFVELVVDGHHSVEVARAA